ncbi:toxin [Streptomyces albus subsp. albus]|nr:toxin [Streptomyces albus subsp. albus]
MRTTPDLSTAIWRKSSHSNHDGGDCVEVAEAFPGAARWRKSSYSNNDGGECVEVADNVPGLVPVRDSKDPDGPALVFGSSAWSSFVSAVKRGEFPTA